MNHFIYEIDERKLKLMFQEMEEPMPPDAWEQLQATGVKEETATSIQLPEISLNRTAILAVGFVLLAGLLALGIYKIIHIEPKGPSKATIEPVSLVTDTAPATQPTIVSPPVEKPVVKVAQDTVTRPAPPPLTSSTSVLDVSNKTTTPTESRKEPTVSAKKTSSIEKLPATDSVPIKKKKSKKRAEKPNVEPEVLQDIRPLPPPPTEEQEIKIN